MTTSLSSFRYVPFLFLLKPVNDQYTQYYLLYKEPMPMDVEFMVLDLLKAIQPKAALVTIGLPRVSLTSFRLIGMCLP